MNTLTGPRTTASFVARLGIAGLTLAGCTAILVNVLFLQPMPSRHATSDGITPASKFALGRGSDEPVTEISVTPEDTIGRLVVEGDPLVREIQTELHRLGYYAGIADGKFGARTRAAITAYERASGLKPSGQASQRVLDHINYAKQLSAAAATTASLKPMAPSRDVAKVQAALIAIGFDAGKADGVLGDKTREAIRAFQSYRGLVATGTINATLARELGIVLAADG